MNENRILTLDMRVVEAGAETTADVSMTTGSGRIVHGHGTARRHPDDPDVPQIGDEIAAARALSNLSHELLVAASGEIGERQHTQVYIPA